MRLDTALVVQKLVATRSRAHDLIRRGLVRVNGQVCQKPSQIIKDHHLEAEDHPWVSRAALKLEGALNQLPNVQITNRICLDLGASTGGFSEVLLTRGAAHVIAIDVGTDQLHQRLRDHPHLTNRPKTDVRDIRANDFDPLPTVLVCDLSFIALHKALGPALDLAPIGADLIALFKPQFEVGREHLGSGGVVRDADVTAQALLHFITWLDQQGWQSYAQGLAVILGGDGNQETWIAAKKG